MFLQDTELYEIPSAVVTRSSYVPLQTHLRQTEPDRTYLTSYRDHVLLNGKSANRCVRDIWAQMLLCIRGVSAEKAAEILGHFPTPHVFWDRLRTEAGLSTEVSRGLPPPALPQAQVHGDNHSQSQSQSQCRSRQPTTGCIGIGNVPHDAQGVDIQGASFLHRTIQPPERRRQIGTKLSRQIWDLFMNPSLGGVEPGAEPEGDESDA